MADKIVAEFAHLNDTKTKAVYTETGGKETIGSKVYIDKKAMESLGSPDLITLTIAPA